MSAKTPQYGGGARLDGLQQLRAIAALLVVLYHAASAFAPAGYVQGVAGWEQICVFGHAGVEIFFVLSGFIICHVHLGDPGGLHPAWRYLRKRLVRIYPPVILVVLFTMLAKAAAGLSQSIDQILVSLTLVPYHFAYSPPALWTLSHEMLFYLVFLISFVSRRLFLAVLGGWAVLILALFGAGFASFPSLVGLVLSPYNLLFAFGVAAFLLRKRDWSAPLLATGGAIAFATVSAVDVLWNIDGAPAPDRSMRLLTLAYGVASMALVLAATGLTVRSRTLALLGEASFSIYLWHEPTQRALVRLLIRFGLMDPPWRIVAMTAMTLTGIAAGLLAWRYLERPLLDRLRRRLIRSAEQS